MKQISFRELLREPKKIFPIPSEGLEVVRREGNFYIYPQEHHHAVTTGDVKAVLEKSAENIFVEEAHDGDMLWEDYNLMPVYKKGIDGGFCT